MDKFYETVIGHRILNKKYWPPLFEDYMQAEIEWLKENITNNISLVDIGCGEGRHLKILVKRLKKGVGIDTSGTMCSKARKVLRRYSNIQIYRVDAKKTRFKDNIFDYVICMNNTFGNLYEKKLPVLREMKRIVKKGGKIIVSVHASRAVTTKKQLYKNVGLSGIKKIGDYVYTKEGFKSQQFSKEKLRSFFKKVNLKCDIINLNPISYIAITEK